MYYLYIIHSIHSFALHVLLKQHTLFNKLFLFRYVAEDESQTIVGAMKYIFRVETLLVTPRSKFSIKLLKNDLLCGEDAFDWQVGQEVNVTITDGCASLGIISSMSYCDCREIQ